MRWLLGLCAVLALFGCGGATPDDAAESKPELSAEKAAVVEFWQHYRAAMKARRTGQWGEAIELFAKALELNPKHEDSLYYLGNARFESADYEGAAQSWRRLLEVNPMASRAHVQLGQLHSCPDLAVLFDLQEARREFELALELNPEESGPLSRLAEVVFALDAGEQAAKLLDDAMRSNPRAAAAHYLAAYLATREGDSTRAVTLLEAARAAVTVSRVTAVPTLEGDIRPGDQEDRVEETMSRRRLFAALLERLKTEEAIDAAAEAAAVDAYLEELPAAAGS